MTQPINSGAPVPVPGVTGGPAVLGGQLSNDPNDGSVVVAPNPGNVLQVRKGNQPTAFQVYEYFHSNTDFSRIALNSQTNGPFQLAVETLPTSVVRDLQIIANGIITIQASQVNMPESLAVNQVLTGTVNAGAGGTLNLAGNASPFAIIFTIGAQQPWAFLPTLQFVPTANDTYDIGQSTLYVRTVFAHHVDFNPAALSQGNGAAPTLPLLKGSAAQGPTGNGVGWVQVQTVGTPIYLPYFQ